MLYEEGAIRVGGNDKLEKCIAEGKVKRGNKGMVYFPRHVFGKRESHEETQEFSRGKISDAKSFSMVQDMMRSLELGIQASQPALSGMLFVVV